MKQTDVDRALELAVSCHDGQTDKVGLPYILHVIRVWRSVLHHPDEVQVAALLHDVAEDTHVSLDFIGRKFGLNVMNAVDALSKRKGESLDEYLDRVCANKIARIVKHSDSSDNLYRIELIYDFEARKRLRRKYSKVLQRLSE